MDKRPPLIPSRNKNSRVLQSRSAVPRMSTAQHTALGTLVDLHRGSPRLFKAGTAPIATAKLAVTVVIMMNRILLSSSWLGVEFRGRDAVVLVDL